MSRFRIRELRLRNYRAFADVRLKLDDVTFLVGRNGSGKSTLLDGLSFIREALTDSLGTAIERRGNLSGVRRRQVGRGPKRDLWAAVGFESDERSGIYGFQIGTGEGDASFSVKREWLEYAATGFVRDGRAVKVQGDDAIAGFHNWLAEGGQNPKVFQAPLADSLFLPILMPADETWRAVFGCLSTVSFHQFAPREMRAEAAIGSEIRLDRTGSNAGDVLKQLRPWDRAWIAERLGIAVPGIRDVRATARAGRRVIVFDQEAEGGGTSEFDASMMSDGTVRALGILLALRQTPRPSIVLIDEIEDSLHPFARAVLLDAIAAASSEFPVVVSTHDPEVLSHESARGERVRIVEWAEGASRLHHLSRDSIAGLKPPMDVGRLLRSNALWPEEDPMVNAPGDEFMKVSPRWTGAAYS